MFELPCVRVSGERASGRFSEVSPCLWKDRLPVGVAGSALAERGTRQACRRGGFPRVVGPGGQLGFTEKPGRSPLRALCLWVQRGQSAAIPLSTHRFWVARALQSDPQARSFRTAGTTASLGLPREGSSLHSPLGVLLKPVSCPVLYLFLA